MTRIKLCGLTRLCDIEAANRLRVEYVGFVFVPASRRYVSGREAAALKAALDPSIRAVGVFVDENPDRVAELLGAGVIDLAQLHGREDELWLARLRRRTEKPVIRAFRVKSPADMAEARASRADYVLLDSGAGCGRTFDWSLCAGIGRPWFLAGGLDADNVARAVAQLHPWAVDVSSGIEAGGYKDPEKMEAFVRAVRKEGEP